MSDIKRTAQLMLVAEYKNLGIEPHACALMAQGHQPGGVHHAAVQAIIAALTQPEGFVLIKASTLSGLADDAEALIVQTEFREGRRYMRLASVREAREAMNSNQEAVVK